MLSLSMLHDLLIWSASWNERSIDDRYELKTGVTEFKTNGNTASDLRWVIDDRYGSQHQLPTYLCNTALDLRWLMSDSESDAHT
jgi:hypothetical protein